MAILFAGFSADAGNDDKSGIVAVIGPKTITLEEFQDMLVQIRSSGDMLKTLETFTPEGKNQVVNDLIQKRLYAMEASGSGFDKDPMVRKKIDAAIVNVLADTFEEKEIKQLDLSETGLKTFYMAHQELFMTDPRVKARHIVTRTEKEADEALTRVKNGEDFGKVAAERNIDSSKLKGGDLGWVVKGVMVKPFEEVLFSLKAGQVSDIVKTRFGFHIVKAEAIDMGKLRSFEGIKEEVKMRMVDQHISQLREDLEKKYPVQINREVLQEIK